MIRLPARSTSRRQSSRFSTRTARSPLLRLTKSTSLTMIGLVEGSEAISNAGPRCGRPRKCSNFTPITFGAGENRRIVKYAVSGSSNRARWGQDDASMTTSVSLTARSKTWCGEAIAMPLAVCQTPSLNFMVFPYPHPHFREPSNAGRIRDEYFTVTLGLNPGRAVGLRCPLLFVDENVSEMGLGVAAGSYVIA